MEILTRITMGGQALHCGIVTSAPERAAVRRQRFRVYQRRGYHRPGLRVDWDAYDRRAIYFAVLVGGGELEGTLLASARLVPGDRGQRFRFPTETIFNVELPPEFRAIPFHQRAEVSRLVTESVHGVLIGGFLTPLGLIQAMTVYSRRHGIQLGLSIMKTRFLRALNEAGLPFHELGPAQPTYPEDGPLAGYFFRHPDPVVPVCWLEEEIAPVLERTISRHEARS